MEHNIITANTPSSSGPVIWGNLSKGVVVQAAYLTFIAFNIAAWHVW